MATDGKVHLTHPDTGGETVVDDLPGVVPALEARGWVRSDEVPARFDPDAPDLEAADLAALAAEAEVVLEPDPLDAAARLIAEREAAQAELDEPVADEPDPLEAAARLLAEREAAAEAQREAELQSLVALATPEDDPAVPPGGNDDPADLPADMTGE